MELRDDQLGAFSADRARQREARLAAHLRARHGDLVAGLSDEALSRRVRVGVRRAATHGITWDSTLAAYLVLMLRVSPRFDEHPVVRAILDFEDLPPDLRIDALMAVTDDEHWEEIAAARDERAWEEEP